MAEPTTDTATLTAYREGKRPWHEIPAREAYDGKIHLPRADMWGPVNEVGDECPWPWTPEQMVGMPIGQFHCDYCGAMVMAGVKHLDYIGLDEMVAADQAQQPPAEPSPEVNGW